MRQSFFLQEVRKGLGKEIDLQVCQTEKQGELSKNKT